MVQTVKVVNLLIAVFAFAVYAVSTFDRTAEESLLELVLAAVMSLLWLIAALGLFRKERWGWYGSLAGTALFTCVTGYSLLDFIVGIVEGAIHDPSVGGAVFVIVPLFLFMVCITFAMWSIRKKYGDS